MSALEERMLELSEVLDDLKRGQARAAAHAAAAREAARVEAVAAAATMLSQSQSLVALGANVLAIRNEFSKWAAAGSLFGAVLLFIAVRMLGLG